jgi:hypothetical protein
MKAWNQAISSHLVDVLRSHPENLRHFRHSQSLVSLLQHFDKFHGRQAFEEASRCNKRNSTLGYMGQNGGIARKSAIRISSYFA